MALAPARAAFMPPPTPGLGRAVALALLAHAALVAALSFAVQWRQSAPEPVTFAAELWATVPVEAAPPAPETPPMESAVEPTPAPVPPPAAPEPPQLADIALEKQKAKQEAKKKQDLEKDRAQLEKDKAEKLRAEKEKSAKLKEDKLKDEKRLKEEKTAQAARKKELAQAKQDEAQSAQRVKEQTERALRLAAATGNGDPHASGSAAQSAGPSASYGVKIEAAIRPNITQLKEVAGNPSVEYDVYTDPSGNVLSAKLRKTSGNPYWDETAYNAILKTGKLPRDENGRVPSPMTIALAPKAP